MRTISAKGHVSMGTGGLAKPPMEESTCDVIKCFVKVLQELKEVDH